MPRGGEEMAIHRVSVTFVASGPKGDTYVLKCDQGDFELTLTRTDEDSANRRAWAHEDQATK